MFDDILPASQTFHDGNKYCKIQIARMGLEYFIRTTLLKVIVHPSMHAVSSKGSGFLVIIPGQGEYGSRNIPAAGREKKTANPFLQCDPSVCPPVSILPLRNLRKRTGLGWN
jgi:hypothetical protein